MRNLKLLFTLITLSLFTFACSDESVEPVLGGLTVESSDQEVYSAEVGPLSDAEKEIEEVTVEVSATSQSDDANDAEAEDKKLKPESDPFDE